MSSKIGRVEVGGAFGSHEESKSAASYSAANDPVFSQMRDSHNLDYGTIETIFPTPSFSNQLYVDLLVAI